MLNPRYSRYFASKPFISDEERISGQVPVMIPTGRVNKRPARLNRLNAANAGGPVDTLNKPPFEKHKENLTAYQRRSPDDAFSTKRARTNTSGASFRLPAPSVGDAESISGSSAASTNGSRRLRHPKVETSVNEYRSVNNYISSTRTRRRSVEKSGGYAGIDNYRKDRMRESATSGSSKTDREPTGASKTHRSTSPDELARDSPPPANVVSDLVFSKETKTTASSGKDGWGGAQSRARNGRESRMNDQSLLGPKHQKREAEPIQRTLGDISLKRAVNGSQLFEPDGGFTLVRDRQTSSVWKAFGLGEKCLCRGLWINQGKLTTLTFAPTSQYLLIDRARSSHEGIEPKLLLEFDNAAHADTLRGEILHATRTRPSVNVRQTTKEQLEKIAARAFCKATDHGVAEAEQEFATGLEDASPIHVRDAGELRPTSTKRPILDSLQASTRDTTPSKTQPSSTLPSTQERRRSTRSSATSQTTSYFSAVPAAPPKPEPEPEPVRWTAVNRDWQKDFRRPVVYPPTGRDRATVVASDIPKLDEGELVNDSLIFFGLRYMQIRAEAKRPELAKRVYLMNTYFYEALKKQPRGGDNIRKWTSKVDLLSYDYIVVPVNESLHWYLAIICHPAKLIPGAEEDVEDAAISETNGTEEPSSQAPDQVESVEPKTESHFVVDGGQFPRQSAEGQTNAAGKGRKGGKRKRGPPVRRYNPKDARIITMDSLGHTHPSTVRFLREYLLQEIQHRTGVKAEPPTLLGLTAKGIPEQPNFSDCGLYLLGYFRRFMKDPDALIKILTQREITTWSLNSSKLREEIRSNLFDLHSQQHREYVEAKREKRAARAASKESPTKPSSATKAESSSSSFSHVAERGPDPGGVSGVSVSSSRPSSGNGSDTVAKPFLGNRLNKSDSSFTGSGSGSRSGPWPLADADSKLVPHAHVDVVSESSMDAEMKEMTDAPVAVPAVSAVPTKGGDLDGLGRSPEVPPIPLARLGSTSSSDPFEITKVPAPNLDRATSASDPEDAMDLLPTGPVNDDSQDAYSRKSSSPPLFSFDARRSKPLAVKESIENETESRDWSATPPVSSRLLDLERHEVWLPSFPSTGKGKEQIPRPGGREGILNGPSSPSPRKHGKQEKETLSSPSRRRSDRNLERQTTSSPNHLIDLDFDLEDGKVTPEPRVEPRKEPAKEAKNEVPSSSSVHPTKGEPKFIDLLAVSSPPTSEARHPTSAARSSNKRPSTSQSEDSPRRSPKRRKATGIISEHFPMPDQCSDAEVRKAAKSETSHFTENGMDYLVHSPLKTPVPRESPKQRNRRAGAGAGLSQNLNRTRVKSSPTEASTNIIDLTE